MSLGKTALSLYAKLPIPDGLKRVLRRLRRTPESGFNSPADQGIASPPPLLCAGATATAYVEAFNSQADYDTWRLNHVALLNQRVEQEMHLLPGTPMPFALTGYCVACESIRNFHVDGAPPETGLHLQYESINWRESLLCETCGLNNRMRASIDLLQQSLKTISTSELYMTEQLTPLYQWARSKYPGVIGSEYLGDAKTAGLSYAGIRHEDTTALSFATNSLDCVLSFDVLEHIPNYKKALGEIIRCLRPGGILLLSAPFVSDIYETRVRAQILPNGDIQHLLAPEYHGNPTDPESGSLCFYHFGWDLLDEIRAAGAAQASVLSYYSLERGNLGKPQLIFRAQK
jgi:hypothetical protein